MSGDNFRFDITGASLEDSLKVAFTSHKWAVGWASWPRKEEDGQGKGYEIPRLVLFWTKPTTTTVDTLDGSFQAFPSKQSVDSILPVVKAWLAEQNYGSQPDHDGSNGKGWRVYNEAWTYAAGSWCAFVCIEPTWIWYGK